MYYKGSRPNVMISSNVPALKTNVLHQTFANLADNVSYLPYFSNYINSIYFSFI